MHTSSPGGAFAGGTLARDVAFLRELGTRINRPTPLVDGVLASNAAHRLWAQRRLQSTLARLAGSKIAIWGLTYKPGTDTLRRSCGVELCRWLLSGVPTSHVHDPAVRRLCRQISRSHGTRIRSTRPPEQMRSCRHHWPLSGDRRRTARLDRTRPAGARRESLSGPDARARSAFPAHHGGAARMSRAPLPVAMR